MVYAAFPHAFDLKHKIAKKVF